MEFLKGIIKSVSYHLGKIIVYVLLALLLTFAVRSRNVSALTIENNFNSISDSYLNVLKNTYNTSGYKYYVISSISPDSSSYGRYNYYLCLTNNLTKSNFTTNNANVSCDEVYSYYYNNGYSLNKLSDTSISITNSVFYTNYYDTISSNYSMGFSFFTLLILVIIFFFLIFNSLKPKGSGLRYEDV